MKPLHGIDIPTPPPPRVVKDGPILPGLSKRTREVLALIGSYSLAAALILSPWFVYPNPHDFIGFPFFLFEMIQVFGGIGLVIMTLNFHFDNSSIIKHYGRMFRAIWSTTKEVWASMKYNPDD